MKRISNTIKCPNCSHKIDVDTILYNEIEKETKRTYDEEIAKQTSNFNNKLKELELEKQKLAQDKDNIEKTIEEKLQSQLKQEKSKLEREITKKEQQKQQEQLEELEKQLAGQSEELKSLYKTKAEISKLRRQQEELKDKYEAEAQEKINNTVRKEKEQIKRKEREKHELLVLEKEEIINNLNEKLKEAQFKIEQGSVQLQGEIQELAIERWLENQFVLDNIREVQKGARGADCLQTVNTRDFSKCGTIYYESKRTKTFNNNWISKFKDDLRRVNADIGVIVTQAMPKDMERMGMIDGIWICNFEEFKGLSFVLREFLIKLSNAVKTQHNRKTKMERLYDYLIGNEFKLQVEVIVEGFTQMQQDLAKERRYVEGIWKKREKQIQKVLESTTDMYISVKNIAGAEIQDVSLLELPVDEVEEEVQIGRT